MLVANLEAPLAFSVSESGTPACLDRGGARLWFKGQRTLEAPARALAFHGETLAVLEEGRVYSLDSAGAVLAVVPVPEHATSLAVSMGGGLLVGFGESSHGRVLVRMGEHPLVLTKPAGFAVRAIAVDSSGFWIGGDGEVIGYRPTLGAVTQRARLTLEAAVRAMAVGPDGALYVLLADGRRLVRVRDGEARVAGKSDEELCGLARRGRALIGCGASGEVDLTRFVPHAPDGSPHFEVPSCDT